MKTRRPEVRQVLRKDKLLALAVILALLSAAGLVTGCSRAGEIRVGYLGDDLTDDGSEQMTLRGADLAVEEINNAGGIFARKISLVRASYRGDRQKAVEEATRLCTEDRVTAIIGSLPTGIMRVVAPVSQANRVVTVSTGAIGKGVEDAGDCVFRVVPAEDSAAPVIARFLTGGCGWKRFGLAADVGEAGAAYVLELYRAALAANGGQVAASVTVDTANPAKQLAALASKDLQAVIFAGPASNAAAFIAAARAAGLNVPVYVAGVGVDSLLLRAGAETKGVIVAAAADPNQPEQVQRKFHAGFVAKYGREPDAAAARGYDAVRLIAEAMLEARGTKTDLYVETLAATTERMGASGKLTYAAGTRLPVYEPLYMFSLDGGKPSLLATLSQATK